jgi:hypothetical protein
MSIKHSNVVIDPIEPFINCKLDRKQYADVLLELIKIYSDGFVLAINNKWGTGKTTFLKMWEKDLINKEYQTVYFNAWENDFESNPLIALMGELKSLTKVETEPKFKTVLKNAAILSKHIAPIVIQSILDKHMETSTIKDAIVGITKGITDVFEDDVNEYAKKKKGIEEFRTSLSEFIANTNEGRPLIFIIDELDRCRPDYAVSILEQIKHFFSVPNIIFVLSIDKVQLGNSVKGVYGNDNIDAEEYLRRFIDIEYSIPNPNPELFYKYLYNYFNFDQFFTTENRILHKNLQSDKNSFLGMCSTLFSDGQTSLRQQEKIFAHSRLALRAFDNDSFVIPQLFIFLVYVKTIYEDFYIKINEKSLNIEDLQVEFFKVISKKSNKLTERKIIQLEAYFVNTYNNYLNEPSSRIDLIGYDRSSGESNLLIKSISDKSNNGQFFLTELVNIYRFEIQNISIDYLLKKINLTEVFK